MPSYANKLKEYRAGRPVEDVAKAAGVSRSAIQMYEAGARMPRDCTKLKLAEYFGTTVQELFFSA